MAVISTNAFPCASYDKLLEKTINAGFEGLELPYDNMMLIINRQLFLDGINYYRDILKKYKLRYTAHGAKFLDIRNKGHFEMMKKYIDASEILGVEVMTIHFDAASKRDEMEDYAVEALYKLSSYGYNKNVEICLENIEIERAQLVIDCIKKVGHKNMKMTLDTGHLHLTGRYFGDDYYKIVDMSLPFIKNVHINDNVGKFMELRLYDFETYKTHSLIKRTAFGEGDIHLPPFLGNCDIDYVIEKLKDREEVFITCEYNRKDFHMLDKQVADTIKRKIGCNTEKIKFIAHRCGTGKYPQLTLQAARHSINNGFDYVELDIRLTKDNLPVILHDSNTGGLFSSDAEVARITLAEFKGLQRNDGTAYGPVSLKDILEEGIAPLVFDVKITGDKIEILLDHIEKYNYEKKCIVGLRDLYDLKKVHNSGLATLAFVNSVNDIEEFMEAGADIIRLWDPWVTKELIDKIHSCNKKVFVTAGAPKTNTAGISSYDRLMLFKKLNIDGILIDKIPHVKW